MITSNEKKTAEMGRQFVQRTALQIAIIAGIFSAVLMCLLAVNYVQTKVVEPLQAERLEMLKVKLLDQPGSSELPEAIRELDLKLRQGKVYRLKFGGRASLLLLIGLGVFLSAWKLASSLNQDSPRPTPQHDVMALQVRRAVAARWAITAGFAVLCVLGLFAAARREAEFGDEMPAYPSAQQWASNWPSFRGPEGSGISAHQNVPLYWNEETGKGILWKSGVALPGHNSPVVWEDRVFVAGADEKRQQVYSFDAADGQLLWTGKVPRSSTDKVEVMEDTGYSAPTMVVDGRRAYVIFASGDLAAFDFEGKLVWSKSLGLSENAYGFASSLCMYQNLLIIQYDQGYVKDSKSCMIALDSFSGSTVWEARRPVGSSWTSPIVARTNDQYQLITCSNPFVIAYDPKSGTELWRVECLGEDLGASPICVGDYAVVVSPYEHVVTIRTNGRGNVTDTHIVWTAVDGMPDICSPVSDGRWLFLLSTQGTLTCYELESGQKLYERDLELSFQASPSTAGKNIYLMSDEGETIIAELSKEFKEIGRCKLNEGGFASPAFVDGRIFVRTANYLYCLGAEN